MNICKTWFKRKDKQEHYLVGTCEIVIHAPFVLPLECFKNKTPTDGCGLAVSLVTASLCSSTMSCGCLPLSTSDDSTPSLSKDISSALSTVPECFDSEGGFPLEDELRIEPLSLDGLSMLSDPDMVLPDPSVEDTFRSDRL